MDERFRPPSFGMTSSFGLTPNPEKVLEEMNPNPLVNTWRARSSPHSAHQVRGMNMLSFHEFSIVFGFQC